MAMDDTDMTWPQPSTVPQVFRCDTCHQALPAEQMIFALKAPQAGAWRFLKLGSAAHQAWWCPLRNCKGLVRREEPNETIENETIEEE